MLYMHFLLMDVMVAVPLAPCSNHPHRPLVIPVLRRRTYLCESRHWLTKNTSWAVRPCVLLGGDEQIRERTLLYV
jgi:hypothetical protein